MPVCLLTIKWCDIDRDFFPDPHEAFPNSASCGEGVPDIFHLHDQG